MSYNPRPEGPIRVTFDSVNRRYIIQQEGTRRRNGAVFPKDTNEIPLEGEQFWKTVGIATSLFEAVRHCVHFMYEENRRIESFDLGTVTTNGPIAAAVVDELLELRL